LAVKTRARVRTLAQWVNHVKMAEAAVLHIVTQLLRQVSVQHSLKNQETRVHRVTHAHQQVALATARCAEVVKTRVAIGHLRVVPTASHVMVPLVLRLVRLATAMRVRHVMTVLLVVTSVHAMTARLAHLMATVRRVVILDLIVRLVHSATAMRVRHVMTVLRVVTLVQTVQLVMTARLAHLMATVLIVVISDLIVRLVLSTAILVRRVVTLVQTARRVRLVPTVMVVVQTA
jgi:hypothetical protein